MAASGFMAGAIVGKMILDRTKWSASVKKVKEDEKKLGGMAEGTAKKFNKMGRGMTIAGAAITGAMGAMVGAAIELNKGMANVATLIPTATARLYDLRTIVQDLAVTTGKSTDDITGGLYQVISAFGDGADTAKILEINVRAAAAGLATTTDSINLTSAVMKGYGDVSAEATMKTADLAFMTVKLGQTTFPELAASMGQVIPLAAKMNVSQKELFATFATLTGVTGKASEVTTQLRSVMAGMMKPTEDMSKAIEQLGYDTAEAMIADLGLVGSMRKLIGTTDGSTKAVGKLFNNVRALPAVFALTGGQAEVFNEKLLKMEDTAGAMEGAFEAMTQGINKTGFDMARLKQMTIVLSQKIGEHLAPTIGKIVVSFGKVVAGIGTWMKEHPKLTDIIIKGTAAIGALMLVLGPMLIMLPGLVIAIAKVKLAVVAVTLAVKGFSIATIAALAPIALLVGAAAALTLGWMKVKKAQDAANKSAELAAETEDRLFNKLKRVTDQAGLTEQEFLKLRDAYHGNAGAMAMAIKRGDEGVEMQKALAEAASEAEIEMGAEKTGVDDLTGAFEKLLPAGKAWIEYLSTMGILTTEAKRAKADELYGIMENLNTAYADGTINLAEWTAAIKKANDELETLTSTEAMDVEVKRKGADILAQLGPLTQSHTFAMQTSEEQIRSWALANQIGIDETYRGMYELTSLMMKFAGVTMPALGKAAKDSWPQIKGVTDKTKEAWIEVSTVVSDLSRKWATSLTDTLGIAKFFYTKATEFDNAFYASAIENIEMKYGKNKEALDQELSDLENHYVEIDNKLEQNYEKEKAHILASVKDEEEKQAMLEALEKKHQLDLENSRAGQRSAEETLRNELTQLEKDYQAELEIIRGDEAIAMEDHRTDELEKQNSLWSKMKAGFGEVIADMVKLWVTKFIGKILMSATEGFSTVGKTISGTMGGIGESIKGVGTGLGQLIISLAKGIAGAAKIIAAAAGPILIAAGVALAIFAGFKLLGSLFKKKAKPGSELDFLRQIAENSFTIKDLLLGDYKAELHILQNAANESQKHLFAIQARADRRNVLLTSIDGYVKITAKACEDMVAALKNVTSAQQGAIINSTELVMAHGTTSDPEVIQRQSDIAKQAAQQTQQQQQKQYNLYLQQTVEMKGTMISDRDYVRQRLLPEMLNALETKQGVDRMKKFLGL